MARIHGITRQALIHYDNIELFRPEYVDTNGYRYYSKRQIPYLREICFLKSLGISLREIEKHFQQRTPESERLLLEKQKRYIVSQIAKLSIIRERLRQRIEMYDEAMDADVMLLSQPFVRYIEARKVILREWLRPISRENLHVTMMELWQRIFEKEMIPTSGFGSLIRRQAFADGNWYEGASSCVFLPMWNNEYDDSVIIPAGTYVCMYKYGMPYDTEHLEHLKKWLEENNYELLGDVVDACLLDTTFYKNKKSVDFCMLQALVRQKN